MSLLLVKIKVRNIRVTQVGDIVFPGMISFQVEFGVGRIKGVSVDPFVTSKKVGDVGHEKSIRVTQQSGSLT